MVSLAQGRDLLLPAVWSSLPGWEVGVCYSEELLYVALGDNQCARVLLATAGELKALDLDRVGDRIEWIKRKYANGGPLEIQSSMAA